MRTMNSSTWTNIKKEADCWSRDEIAPVERKFIDEIKSDQEEEEEELYAKKTSSY